MAVTACAFCGADPDAEIGGRWSIFLDRHASSLNDRKVNLGHQRHAYARERDEWYLLARSEMVGNRVPRASTRRRLVIMRIFAGRQSAFDHANFVGGCKPLVDALVLAGVLVDDSATHLEDHYRQRRARDGEKPGVHIVVEDLI